MRIAVLASEGAPYAKSGGLGDVMEALPSALARIEGNEVALILPYYQKIKENPSYETELVAQFQVTLGWRRQYCGLMKLKGRTDGVTVYFLDNDYYFGGRSGAIYGDGDDAERFAYFSKACLDAMADQLHPRCDPVQRLAVRSRARLPEGHVPRSVPQHPLHVHHPQH